MNMEAKARVTPGRWLGMGWGIIRDDIGNFILLSVVALALSTVGSFLVGGPLIAGMFLAVRRRMLEGRTDLMDLFAGFNHFIDAFLIHIIVAIFCLVGLVLCVFPAFIVVAFYLFAYLFMLDRKLAFWDAMESSRRLVLQDLLGYLLFVILLILVNFLGLLLLGVGLLVTFPVSIAAIAVAYQEMVGFTYRPAESQGPVVIG
jgi:uncharacterized membrane protein